MNEGYISVYRQIFDHWTWKKKPFSEGQAWIDLLLLTNYTDKKVKFDRNITEVKRGSFITSIRILSERWGWSRDKVSHFLNCLECDEMLSQKRTTRCTTLTIVKYDNYQNQVITKKPLKSHSPATEKPLPDTTNKVNKDNKVNKKDISPPAPEEELPEGAVKLPDGSVSYANVKRVWD
jgi:hypothetical protein